MVHADLAPMLRQQGDDAESCQEAGRSNQGIGDEEQLEYATQQGRAILSFNVRHFYALDAAWKAAGRRHAGILLSKELDDLSTLFRLVQQHIDNCSPSQQHDTVLWLGTVGPP
jgi:hypothetical protein